MEEGLLIGFDLAFGISSLIGDFPATFLTPVLGARERKENAYEKWIICSNPDP